MGEISNTMIKLLMGILYFIVLFKYNFAKIYA